jgi:hypothetical protein
MFAEVSEIFQKPETRRDFDDEHIRRERSYKKE